MLHALGKIVGAIMLLAITGLGFVWCADLRGFTTRYVRKTFKMKINYGENPGPTWMRRRLLRERITGAIAMAFGFTMFFMLLAPLLK